MSNTWVLNIFDKPPDISVTIDPHFAFGGELSDFISDGEVDFKGLRNYYMQLQAISELDKEEEEELEEPYFQWKKILLSLNQPQLEKIVRTDDPLRLNGEKIDSLTIQAQRKGLQSEISHIAVGTIVILYTPNREKFLMIKRNPKKGGSKMGFLGGFCPSEMPEGIPGIENHSDIIAQSAALHLFQRLGLVSSGYKEGQADYRVSSHKGPTYKDLNLIGVYTSRGENTSCANVFVYEAELEQDLDISLKRFDLAKKRFEKLLVSQGEKFAKEYLKKLQVTESLPSLAWRIEEVLSFETSHHGAITHLLREDEDQFDLDAFGGLTIYLGKNFLDKLHKPRSMSAKMKAVDVTYLKGYKGK